METENIANQISAVSSNGMVASPHHVASRAGAEILSAGGSAVDALVATNAALTVVYPHMCGLGGDLFAQVWDPKKKQLRGLNASGRSSSNATIDFFQSHGLDKIDMRGPFSAITVPGVVNGWKKLHDEFGKLDWENLFSPAIELTQGFNISRNVSDSIAENLEALKLSDSGLNTFTHEGKPLKTGDLLVQPDLRKSLEQIAMHGADTFYSGRLGETILAGLREKGGILSESDFASNESDWVSPITVDYGDYTVAETPPNSQGLLLLMMLSILKNVNWKTIDQFSAEYFHLFVEAFKAVLTDREKWITDPSTIDIPLEKLLSDDYGLKKYEQIDPMSASVKKERIEGESKGDTVYLCAVDGDGLAVSMIQSIFLEFGSGVMLPQTGVMLQNRGAAFSLDPKHPNHLSPSKRTFHTLMPAMVLKDGDPCYVIGTMGGEGQPQTIASVLINMFEYHSSIEEAIDAPRWFFGRRPGDIKRILYLESRIPREVADELSRMGHEVRMLEAYSKFMGHCQGIQINQETHTLSGTADPRSDGAAIGI